MESLEDLDPYNSNVHILLHWPRCDNEIEWMDCEGEEKDLPQYVKDAGPDPSLNPNAFLDSWRALEELYVQYKEIASIGVSNFSVEDWELLVQNCKIIPHIHQGHVWSFFNDADLRKILDDNRVLFQAYNVAHRVLGSVPVLERVQARLEEIVQQVPNVERVSTLILAWFLQNRLGVVVRSTNREHLIENSPSVVGVVGRLSDDIKQEMANLIHYLVNGQDLLPETNEKAGVSVTFVNERNKDVMVYWVNEDSQELVHVNQIEANGRTKLGSHPGHRFVVKESLDGKELKSFKVNAEYGESEEFYVEL